MWAFSFLFDYSNKQGVMDALAMCEDWHEMDNQVD